MKFKSLIVLSALLVTGVVLAASMTYTWTSAVKNTDGSDIPSSGAGSLSSTTVEWSLCGPSDTFGTRLGTVVGGPTATSAATPDTLAPGRYCSRAFHINTYGVASDPTAVVVKVINAPKPNPPSNFSIG